MLNSTIDLMAREGSICKSGTVNYGAATTTSSSGFGSFGSARTIGLEAAPSGLLGGSIFLGHPPLVIDNFGTTDGGTPICHAGNVIDIRADVNKVEGAPSGNVVTETQKKNTETPVTSMPTNTAKSNSSMKYIIVGVMAIGVIGVAMFIHSKVA